MRYYWNDKEVSVDEYKALDLEWKKGMEAQELLEKNLDPQNSSYEKNPPGKSSRKKSGF